MISLLYPKYNWLVGVILRRGIFWVMLNILVELTLMTTQGHSRTKMVKHDTSVGVLTVV